MAVRDAQSLDGAIDGQHIGKVAVVEPEARGADQDGPVAGVFGEGMVEEHGREEDGQLEKRREVHRGRGCRLEPDKVRC